MKINLALFTNILSMLKHLHWVTESYSAHMALDEAYDELTDTLDSFVETALGIYGRKSTFTTSIVTKLVSDTDIKKYVESELVAFNNEIAKIVGEFPELQSIFDEIKSIENTLMYKLAFTH